MPSTFADGLHCSALTGDSYATSAADSRGGGNDFRSIAATLNFRQTELPQPFRRRLERRLQTGRGSCGAVGLTDFAYAGRGLPPVRCRWAADARRMARPPDAGWRCLIPGPAKQIRQSAGMLRSFHGITCRGAWLQAPARHDVGAYARFPRRRARRFLSPFAGRVQTLGPLKSVVAEPDATSPCMKSRCGRNLGFSTEGATGI